jgi:putative NADPH-quinone reductase
MHALILLADPRPGSLCSEGVARAADALTRAGHDVVVRDLHAEGFTPAMTAEEREAYHGDTPILDPQVAEHADLVTISQILVFAYHTELSTMPPVLKGWLERVLVPGVGFVLDHRNKVRPGLLHVKRIVGISTYAEGRVDVKMTHDNGRRTITRAVRMSAGTWTRTRWVPLYAADEATAAERAAFLERCGRRIA